MTTRVGRVTATYPATGKVKVTYEDTGNTSLPVSLLTMNSEYSMPAVGDRVVTLHMENGSSKGFCLGTYYGGGTTPRATTGYRKDLDGTAYIVCAGGVYDLNAVSIKLETDGVTLSLGEEVAELEASGDASIKAEGNIAIEGDEIGLKAESAMNLTSGAEIGLESEGEMTLSSGASLSLEAGGALTLSGDAGSITLEELLDTLKDYGERLTALDGKS